MVIISNNKIKKLTEQIKEYAYNLDLDEVKIASADNELFLQAPANHQPKNILNDAKSIIILGKTLPRSIFKLKNHQSILVHRAYHSLYKHLDIVAVRICNYIESLGFHAISIPSYVPLAIENLEPWGVISLKHAGLAAGLGKIAKNGLLIHPEFGTLIRLSGIITTAELISDKILEEDICFDCNLCIENCPTKALKNNGKFSKLKCLNNVVKHGVNILHP